MDVQGPSVRRNTIIHKRVSSSNITRRKFLGNVAIIGGACLGGLERGHTSLPYNQWYDHHLKNAIGQTFMHPSFPMRPYDPTREEITFFDREFTSHLGRKYIPGQLQFSQRREFTRSTITNSALEEYTLRVNNMLDNFFSWLEITSEKPQITFNILGPKTPISPNEKDWFFVAKHTHIQRATYPLNKTEAINIEAGTLVGGEMFPAAEYTLDSKKGYLLREVTLAPPIISGNLGSIDSLAHPLAEALHHTLRNNRRIAAYFELYHWWESQGKPSTYNEAETVGKVSGIYSSIMSMEEAIVHESLHKFLHTILGQEEIPFSSWNKYFYSKSAKRQYAKLPLIRAELTRTPAAELLREYRASPQNLFARLEKPSYSATRLAQRISP